MMTLEIELKFIVTPLAVSRLTKLWMCWPCQPQEVQRLSNTYYDTAQNKLRCFDMGLRLRGEGERYEMTLKTAGQSLAGFHQRLEYNVELVIPQLDLRLLPAEVWPKGCDIVRLQAELQPLFSTHFQRESWIVSYRNSEIEVAFDQGEITAGELSEPLYEIELELKSGECDDLMVFAAELVAVEGIRLGSLSKAARGYYLLKGRQVWRNRALEIMKPRPKANVEQGMIDAFSFALYHWQYHEEVWLRGEEKAQYQLQEALALLRQIFVLFGSIIPRKASHTLRQGLVELENRLKLKKEIAENICYSPLSVKTQLALHHWITNLAWCHDLDEKKQLRLAASFKRFADIMLGRIGIILKQTFSRRHQLREYHDKQRRLLNARLSLYLLSGAYPPEVVAVYVMRWEALEQAIIRQQETEIELNRKLALKQPVFWLQGR